MPTYEYECDACQHNFEEFQSITAEALKKCPSCGKKKLRRLIGGGAAVLFKGSGFYQTDYRSESYKQAAKKDQGTTEAAPKSDKTGSNGTADAGKPALGGATSEKKGAVGKRSKSES
jgi:putative FmdB family regulatory protein